MVLSIGNALAAGRAIVTWHRRHSIASVPQLAGLENPSRPQDLQPSCATIQSHKTPPATEEPDRCCMPAWPARGKLAGISATPNSLTLTGEYKAFQNNNGRAVGEPPPPKPNATLHCNFFQNKPYQIHTLPFNWPSCKTSNPSLLSRHQESGLNVWLLFLYCWGSEVAKELVLLYLFRIYFYLLKWMIKRLA